DRDLGDPGLPRHPLAGLGQELPGDLLRHVGRYRDRDERILRGYPNTPARLLLLPAALQVMGPGRHVADPIVGLRVPPHPKRGRFEVGYVDGLLGDQGIGSNGQLFNDLVLQQAVHDDNIGSQQLLTASDLPEDGGPMVDDELEVEIGDPGTGVAWARRRLADVATTAAEPEV